jgi:hypothetical protein
MSWMRFLAAGQSFIGMRRKNSPYREADQSWLQSAGAICAPAAGTEEGQANSGGARSLAAFPESAPLLSSPAPAMRATRHQAAELFGASELQAPCASAIATQAHKEAAPARRTRAARGRAASSLFKPRHPLVQGELSLDTVKVVRNDLHDSDLELIPAQQLSTRPVGARGVAGLFGRLANPVPKLAEAQP